MKNSKVSIIVPAYGVENYLSECIDSILAQSHRNIEVIIVDDKSPDRSGEIADNYATLDARVKVIHKQKNEGLNSARATGFSLSTGNFVTFVDSDDKVKSRFIQDLLDAQKNTQADITMSGYIFYDSKLQKPLENQPVNWRSIDENGPQKYTQTQMIRYYLTQWLNWQHNNNTTTTHSKLFKRAILEGIDWSLCDYSIGEDDFETIYTFSKAEKYAVINNQSYLYRVNPDSISNSKRFTPKYRGNPITVFQMCRDFEQKSIGLFGKKFETEVYYRLYLMYVYYIQLLLTKGSMDIKDVADFDLYFPLKKIRNIKGYDVDLNMMDKIEEGGLIHYVTSLLHDEKIEYNLRLDTLEKQISNQDAELNILRGELMAHKGIKASSRLVARNIRNRLSGRRKK